MILNKALLLKCLGGVAACLGTASLAVVGSKSFGSNDASSDSGLKLNELLAKVGLSGCTTPNQECSIGETGLKVKQGDNKEDSKTKDTTSSTGSPAGKIKVYSDSNYENKFKFVIEEGNINLTGGNGTITKLEQFETYEIKKEENQDLWYFSRKDKAGKKIKELLGLPEACSLPDSNSSTCDIESGKINEINFEGKGNTTTVTGTVTLTITKLTTPEEDFSFDYKFEFKGKEAEVTLTINSKQITLKSNEATEFKIKKGESENSLTLEEAWSLNRLLEKVGLSGCTTENGTECTIANEGLKVKHESGNGEEGKTKDTANGGSTGKIKVYKENTSTTYNKGFKFVIEEGDIKLTGGTGTQITKLEEFETYEIKKESDKWYFYRKDKAEEGIKKALGIDGIDNCNFPTDANNPSICCDLDAEKLKKIKFDGKPENQDTSTSGTTKLTITKVSDDSKSDFPFGYKFAFESTEDITIPQSSNSISIKKNTNTEFKIKATSSTSGSARTLTLEKAWDIDKWGKKVGLTCAENNGNKECTLPTDNSLKLYNSDSDNTTSGKATDTTKKLKYEEDQEGYNQGFKFYADDDIDLDDSKKIEKKGDDSSAVYYEIKQQTVSGSSNWYLSKHTTVSQ